MIKRIAINDGPEYIEVDLADRTRYFRILREIEAKKTELMQRGKGNADGSPEDKALGEEFADYLRGRIDEIFGAGTSRKDIFAKYHLGVILQFIAGLRSYLATVKPDQSDAGKHHRHGKKK